jgi:putative tryptophan/tyrosine transport system substrate-binding protein
VHEEETRWLEYFRKQYVEEGKRLALTDAIRRCAIRKLGCDSLLIEATDILLSHRNLIASLAAQQRLPTISRHRGFVLAGGLASYGESLPDLFRRAATYVDKLLKGASPADLPVEQPTRFELAINVKTAKALGIEIPSSLLARADEVIE